MIERIHPTKSARALIYNTLIPHQITPRRLSSPKQLIPAKRESGGLALIENLPCTHTHPINYYQYQIHAREQTPESQPPTHRQTY